jgi:hypothetical protein
MRLTFKSVAIFLVLVALAVAASLYAYPRIVRFFAIDNCLDSGGAWHNEQCVH